MILRTLGRALWPFVYSFMWLTKLMELLTDGLADLVDDSLSEWWGRSFWLSLPPLIAGLESSIQVSILVAALEIIVLTTYTLDKVQTTASNQ